jgi:predicted alpha/beta-hydrolase family hydrolase
VAAGDPLELDTPHGIARVHLRPVEAAVAALVLGHGAGGSVSAPDLLAVADAARDERVAVALVEQPYRVAGRRSPAPARQLDVAWVAVVEQLRAGPLAGLDVVVGGRSSGARVACRTAAATEARAVLCLAFPLQPPRRRSAAGPPPSRLEELDAVQVPVLVVQGDRDPFGLPPGAPGRTVAAVAGTHRLSSDLDGVAAAARAWLGDLLA